MEVVGKTLDAAARAAITASVWRHVDALPQRDLIDVSDAAQWIGKVVELHREQAVWHAIRLNGFGGSEIGVLVRNRHGIRADHQASAHDIVLGKLMRKVPDETNAQMTRGHKNEPIHAQEFYAKYGAHRDEEAFLRLSRTQGSLPWMRYSPDEVAMMPSKLLLHTQAAAASRPLSRILADYKAPTVVEQSTEIHFQYGCQLHQGAILCEEAGIEIHGLLLSQFDWANYCLKDDVVAVDEGVKDLIRDAGNWAWDLVMHAEVPPYIRTPVLAESEAFAKENSALATAMASALALSKAAKDHAQTLRDELERRLGPKRFEGKRLTMPGIGYFSAAMKVDGAALHEVLSDEQFASVQVTGDGYDDKKMEQYLRAQAQASGDREFMKKFRKLRVDPDKLAEHADAFGIDPERFAVEEMRFTVNPEITREMERYMELSYPTDGPDSVIALPAPAADATPEVAQVQVQEEEQEQELETAEAPRG